MDGAVLLACTALDLSDRVAMQPQMVNNAMQTQWQVDHSTDVRRPPCFVYIGCIGYFGISGESPLYTYAGAWVDWMPGSGHDAIAT